MNTSKSIGLHLHPWLTEELLRKAGIIPKATKQDGAYRYLYTFLYKNSIEDCNKYLKSQKLQEFVQRENKSRSKAKARKNKHIVIDHGSGIKNPWPIFFTQKDIKNVPFKSLCVQGNMRNRREVRGFAKRLE